MWKSVLRRLAAAAAIALVLFLAFFQTIVFLWRGAASFISESIVPRLVKFPPPGATAEAFAHYGAVDAAVYNASNVLFGGLIGLVLLAVGWSISSVSVNLARTLGYRTDSGPEVLARQASEQLARAPKPDQTVITDTPAQVGEAANEAEKPLLGLESARLRLEAHITSLRNASILNLFVGIGIAAAGIFVLYTAFVDIEKFGASPERTISSTDFFIFTLLPRISATLFIQIFAYFFLLMYRSNLSDIRYFQNEMTNLDAYATAITLSLRSEISTTQKAVIAALSKVERNRVMAKSQKVINPSDDNEIHQKLLNNMSQLLTKVSDVLSKSGK
jgi:hypothetical protein